MRPNARWMIRHPLISLLSWLGHWEWEHEFKECPAGERHCPHMHWRPGKAKDDDR